MLLVLVAGLLETSDSKEMVTTGGLGKWRMVGEEGSYDGDGDHR